MGTAYSVGHSATPLHCLLSNLSKSVCMMIMQTDLLKLLSKQWSDVAGHPGPWRKKLLKSVCSVNILALYTFGW